MSIQPLYRLTYASRSTFKPFLNEGGVDGNIAQILNTARESNKKAGLVGALYYGNGCFFQCLEGKKEQIDLLFEKLLKDSRHKDLKILSYQPIVSSGFSSWEMKYATIDNEVRSFLRQHGITKFDPYKFNDQMTANLVEMLQKADEANQEDILVDGNSMAVASYQNTNLMMLAIASILVVLMLVYLL
jgi:hypothetical protein